MTEHTKEPWVVRELELYEGGSGIEIVGADGYDVANNQTYYPKAITEANARRIVAAVNACAGISTEQLENPPNSTQLFASIAGRLTSNNMKLRDDLSDVTAQRNQLLAALEAVRNAGEWYTSAIELDMDIDGNELLEVVDQAIAAVKGGAAC
jgi:hypothetical protein